jgi:hypothetical protein
MAENEKGRIPEVGEYVRMYGTLVEIQDVTPPPPPTPVLDYIFEDTDARVEVLAGGHIVKDGPTINNFYGKDTCVAGAIEEAKKLAKHYGTGVEVRVVKVTSRVRMRPSRDVHLYDRTFVHFNSLYSGARWDLAEPIEEVVWSSAKNRSNPKRAKK